MIKEALTDKEDRTKFFLLYANQSPSDILLRGELDAWARDYPNRVKISYFPTPRHYQLREFGSCRSDRSYINPPLRLFLSHSPP